MYKFATFNLVSVELNTIFMNYNVTNYEKAPVLFPTMSPIPHTCKGNFLHKINSTSQKLLT